MNNDKFSEYFLLKNYSDQSLYTRGILGKMTLTYLELVKNDTVPFAEKEGIKKFHFVSGEKEKVLSLLQTDFVSKLLLYIEDFAIFAESFRQKRSFYDIVSSKDPKDDVGLLVEKFLKNADNYSLEEYLGIMSYVNPEHESLEEEEKKLLKKITDGNISEMRRIFRDMYEFGKTHHPIFKRFKHAGFPIVFGLDAMKSPNFKNYETYLAVLIGKDPLKDVQYIPYSSKVMESYEIIFASLQDLLKDIVINKIASIERGITAIYPHLTYTPQDWTREEWDEYGKVLKKFGERNPFIDIDKTIKLPSANKDDLNWFLNLDKFLDESRKRKVESDEGQKRLLG